MESLDDIAKRIQNAQKKALVLDADTLGDEAAGLLHRLLPGASTLSVEDCSLKNRQPRSFGIEGRLPGVESAGDVRVHVYLCDKAATEATAVRRVCLIVFEGPSGLWLASCLGVHARSMAGYVAGYPDSGYVFSSTDALDWAAAEYPPEFEPTHPREKVRRGLNVKLDLDPGFTNLLRNVFVESPFRASESSVIRIAQDKVAGGKSPAELAFAAPYQSQHVEFGRLKAEFIELEARVPLSDEEPSWPLISLRGAVYVDQRQFPVSFELDLLSQSVVAHLDKVLTLNELFAILPPPDASDTFVSQIFKELGKISLDEIYVVFLLPRQTDRNLSADERLLAAGLSLKSTDPISLVPGFLEIAPVVKVEIDHPLSPELRAWSGELSGNVRLGSVPLEGRVTLPACTFSAHAEVKLAELLKCSQLGLGKIDLLAPLTDCTVVLDVSGDASTKFARARLEVTDDLAEQSAKLELFGSTWHFTSLALDVSYDGASSGNLNYWLEGKVRLGTQEPPCVIDVQGGYQDGWFFRASCERIDPFRIIQDLRKDAFPKEWSSGLQLSEVSIWADFTQKTLSVHGQTAIPWTISEKPHVSLGVETFQFDKTSDGIAVQILVRLDIAEVPLRLVANKQLTQNQAGWEFEAGTGSGEINLGKLAQQFGVADFPEALGRLSITNVSISYNTASSQLAFETAVSWKAAPDLAATLNGLSSLQLAIPNTTRIAGTFGPTEKKLTIELGYEGGERLVFLYDARAAKDESAIILAAYADPTGHPIVIRKLVASLSEDAAKPIPDSLNLTVKNILLAREQRKSDPARYLFGIEIEGGFDFSDIHLPNLPFVGGVQPSAEQKLTLNSLQLLCSKGAFSREDIATLNTLAQTQLELPSRDLSGGVELSGVLQIGSQPKALALPAGNTRSSEPAHAGGPQPAAASDAPSQTDVAADDGTRWLSIQRSFGPVHLERLGLAFKDGRISGLLDAGLDIGGLNISLSGLTVSSPLTKFEPSFDLRGLGIDYRNGPLEIGGAFLKQQIEPAGKPAYTAFSGLAIVRTQTLSLSAIGSFANVGSNPPHPSLLIYAVLNYPIGGPPFFFVTGLAAGFGYNRALNMPSLEALPTFPLVEEATRKGGPPSLPAGQKEQQETLTSELGKLEAYIPPAAGENFLAVGVRFTSFRTVESFALLAVKFGTKLEFDLLGLSTLQSPPAVGDNVPTPIARAQLALKATYLPDDGFLGVQAQLTPDSYVLSNACHLSGGFAFFSWFKNSPDGKATAGEFVLSLGGYHPKFDVPSYYPKPPRLALNWQVSKPGDSYELGIKGDAYFALMPHAVMAGGHLEALWQSGALRAWFNTGADFLINWKPYHYDAHAYVDIGASYTFELFGSHSISVDIGADLHLWGPEFAGEAELHCSIFSVTIHFGDQSSRLSPIGWEEFRKTFLPADHPICGMTARDGLLRELPAEEAARSHWVVAPEDLCIAVDSVIPITELAPAVIPASDKLSIAPVGIKAEVSSKHTVSIVHDGHDVTSEFRFDAVSKSVPVALWGEPQFDESGYLKLPAPETKPAATLIRKIAGYEIRPRGLPETGVLADISVAELGHSSDERKDAYHWESASVVRLDGEAAWNQAQQDMQDGHAGPMAPRRKRLLDALGFSETTLAFRQPVKSGVEGLSKSHRV